jgi:hypothetical protein
MDKRIIVVEISETDSTFFSVRTFERVLRAPGFARMAAECHYRMLHVDAKIHSQHDWNPRPQVDADEQPAIMRRCAEEYVRAELKCSQRLRYLLTAQTRRWKWSAFGQKVSDRSLCYSGGSWRSRAIVSGESLQRNPDCRGRAGPHCTVLLLKRESPNRKPQSEQVDCVVAECVKGGIDVGP